MHRFFTLLTGPLLLGALLIGGCGNTAPRLKIYDHRDQRDVLNYLDQHQPDVVAGDRRLSFSQALAELADRRVVFVGEVHERYDHHLTQLAVLRGLYAQSPKLAIGMEWFQQPFQRHLDDYVAGRIDERQLLERTEYYDRWRYDFRMLRPTLRFAREHRLPLIALNAPTELSRKVGAGGLDSLTPEERAALPNPIHPPDPAYRERLEQIFKQHEGRGDVEHFITAQRVWDETMAANVAKYLQANPDLRMVVFAGIGHVEFRAGIPGDLLRQLPVKVATLTSDLGRDVGTDLVDYYVLTDAATLPPSGMLGVYLETKDGSITIKELPKNSPLHNAGARPGDAILDIDGAAVRTLTDLKVALLEHRPGDAVNVRLRRGDAPASEALDVRVRLQSPPGN